MREIARLGTRQLRLDLPWFKIAAKKPAHPRDPTDPAYDWGRFDGAVQSASRYGIEVTFTVWGTPAWAADTAVPVEIAGSDYARRPVRVEDFGDFAVAAATRYAPKGVLRWEAWNEPNVPLFLMPQWTKNADGTFTNVSAATYSKLLASFYSGIKSVAPNAQVAGLVTAPAASCPDSCPTAVGSRTDARHFIRLLDAPGRRPPMDVVSHHPYPQTRPRESTFAGAAYVDLYDIDRFEEAVDGSYLKGKDLWLTEFGFPTEKTLNYNKAVSQTDQGQYLADAYRRVRENPRIKMFTWYFLQDNADWKSGLKDVSGRQKPAYDAFSFPLAADAVRAVQSLRPVTFRGQVRPVKTATNVALQWNRGNGWESLRTLRTQPDGSFSFRLRPDRTASYRARWTGRDRLGESRDLTSNTTRVVVVGKR